jgi:ribosome-associated translation inhibitor RaiA
MQYHFFTADISAPTVDSFHEYAALRWDHLERFISSEAANLRASLRKINNGRKLFELKVEIVDSGHSYFARVVSGSITEAVDKVNKLLRRQMTK